MFDFGKNWETFSLQNLDDSRLADAQMALKNLLESDDLSDLSFLDVGCGSGLFSIAASRLGAKVTGVDINPLCIQVSEQNAARWNADCNFRKVSALDASEMSRLGTYDWVYAWGSLHHTGQMYRAIELTAACVPLGGKMVLAIYNTHVTSLPWKWIKWFYNRLPNLLQRIMILVFSVIIFLAKWIVTRQWPLQKERGMDFMVDVVDWVGGYPYEYATPDEMIAFMGSLGFSHQKTIPPTVPTGCNEFVFTRIKE